MTQFKKRSHRAKERLETASPRFKWVFRACEAARTGGVEWPQHVFCATDAVEPLAVRELEKGGVLKQFLQLNTDEQITMFASGLMWASWRMTQGIYRFDDAVYDAVVQTEQAHKIPADMLRRLPEWCVYVETPGLTCDFGTGDTQLHGVWACFALNYNRELLMIYADVDGSEFDDIMPPTIHIDTSEETLEAGIKVVMSETGHSDPVLAAKLQNWLLPVVNLLLYLCADREIMHKNKVAEPANPQAKKTKKGWRLFPANTIKTWDVGVRIGAAIRQAQQASAMGAETGRTVRPHVRNAHWRTVVSGKMKDATGQPIPAEKRKRDLRWMPPMAVNVDDVGDLPAVIRKVK